jgi:hypothetical protein
MTEGGTGTIEAETVTVTTAGTVEAMIGITATPEDINTPDLALPANPTGGDMITGTKMTTNAEILEDHLKKEVAITQAGDIDHDTLQ